MLLQNVSIPGEDGLKDIRIEKEKITGISGSKDLAEHLEHPDLPEHLDHPDFPEHPKGVFPQEELTLSLEEAIAFPGLINSHDHLDFNLFPRLGNSTYGDYTQWGDDIHRKNKDRINPVLKIPRLLRTRWGLYKNLLNGFTTVVQHGEKLDTGTEELITVFQDCHCLHSLSTEKNWRGKINGWNAGKKLVAVHIGEGTNELAEREIDRLGRWNFFRRPVVGIHGVAMDERQAHLFHALVWCPDSNYFLLNKTARIDLLKKKLPILFGTDSTLSAGWNAWEQLRLARKEGMLTDRELLDAVTKTPARIWDLPLLGKLAMGHRADLVIARHKKGLQGMDALYATNPEDLLLVVHRGNIRLFDQSLSDKIMGSGILKERFSRITLGRNLKYVQGDLPGLMAAIHRIHPAADLPIVAGPY